jgi:hypothetical protein
VEQWYRDVTPQKETAEPQKEMAERDIIYGSWLNLDPPQLFSCIKGDTLTASDASGCVAFAKEEIVFLNQRLK